jgi:hypothetical protein
VRGHTRRNRAGRYEGSHSRIAEYHVYTLEGRVSDPIRINHSNVAMLPHEILREHGIPVKTWDYTWRGGKELQVRPADFDDAVKTLRSYRAELELK